MTDSTYRPRLSNRFALAAAIAMISLAAACGGGEHKTDGDTGAAAPATVRDMSATPQAGDSTAGVANPTGQPNVAGDTMQARATDPTRSPAGAAPAGAPRP
jgi:hypothetical protein